MHDDIFSHLGDLGFLWGGELYICGRLKDLIIIRGSNHYPQDIERSVENALPQLRAGCTAAFSCPDDKGGEILVFLAEVIRFLLLRGSLNGTYDLQLRENVSPEEYQEICETCKRVVSREHGISISSLCLLKARTIPKTTSVRSDLYITAHRLILFSNRVKLHVLGVGGHI